jgi:hypothetical protein
MYHASTSVLKKYKVGEGYNHDWFEYKPQMDIAQGKTYDTQEFMTITPLEVCPAVKCYLNTGTTDNNPSDVSTTTCSPQNTDVDNKLVFHYIRGQRYKITVDTTQAVFDENYCLSCISEQYYDPNGAASDRYRSFMPNAPLYSSKVINIKLVDICDSDWKFASSHMNFIPAGSGTPASASAGWKLNAQVYQDSGGNANEIVIDASLFGSATR